MSEDKRLFPKYHVERVYRDDSGTISETRVVKDCFVLRPTADPYARQALMAYANACRADLPQLARDLSNWIVEIYDGMPEAGDE